ncbi:MAG: hypothetical protein QM479_11840 [Pseudomonadota bacterium]
MNKNELIQNLKGIKSLYIDDQPINENINKSIVDEFADCLNHPCIENYLLETGLVSNKEQLREALPLYQSAENIMEAFAECYYLLEEVGLVRLKNYQSTFCKH